MHKNDKIDFDDPVGGAQGPLVSCSGGGYRIPDSVFVPSSQQILATPLNTYVLQLGRDLVQSSFFS